jgi:hypothetical protein
MLSAGLVAVVVPVLLNVPEVEHVTTPVLVLVLELSADAE